MASTYSPSLRLELMATGDQSGTWGDTTNTNLGTLLEQSITGYLSKAMADTDQTLTNLNGASDEARNMVVEATGALTAGRNIVVPTAEKLYLIKNSTTGGFAVTVKTSAGTGVAVPMGGAVWVYCDGTNVVSGNNYTAGSTSGAVFTDAGATVGPTYDLFRDSSSPATNDILGRLAFNGRDSAGNKQEYASIEAVIADPTSTSEDGALDFYAVTAGTRTRIMSVGPNLDLATVGQIKFPATQNASSDANTLDDYEEGTWTPTLTFATPGDLSVTYVERVGAYIKIGRLVMVSFTVTTSAFTHTTASGNVQITALPFTPATPSFVFPGALQWQGITKAGYTNVVARADFNSTTLLLLASGSGVVSASVTAADMPSGGVPGFRGTVTYLAQG